MNDTAHSTASTSSTPPSKSTSGGSRKGWLGVLVAAFLLVGGAAFAYLGGWLTIGRKAPADVIGRMLGSLTDVKAARYETEAAFKNEPREPGAQPLSVISKDIFTGQDYVYTSDGKNYHLVYHMKLPPKRTDVVEDYSYESAQRQFVEGVNTATEKVLSLEAGQRQKQRSSR